MYQVSRNGQLYGPYSLEELERYLATGNLLPGDLAKSAEMTQWLPVAQILGRADGQTGSQMPVQPVAFPVSGPGSAAAPAAYPYAASAPAAYPDPPNLHWVAYLALSVVTFSLFSKVFTVVQAVWLKRVQPNSNALYFYIGYYALYVVSIFTGLGRELTYLLHPGGSVYRTHGFSLFLLRVILLVVTRFVMSASLEEHFTGPEPIGLRLNPVLTFFFGGVYFQSQFNRINELRRAARYGFPHAS